MRGARLPMLTARRAKAWQPSRSTRVAHSPLLRSSLLSSRLLQLEARLHFHFKRLFASAPAFRFVSKNLAAAAGGHTLCRTQS